MKKDNHQIKLITINKEDSLHIENCDFFLSAFKRYSLRKESKNQKTKEYYIDFKKHVLNSKLFHPIIKIDSSKKRYIRKKETLENINKKNRYTYNATFIKTKKPIRLQTNIDILERNVDGSVNIYLIKPSIFIKSQYLKELIFSKIVIEFSDIEVKNCFVITLKNEYLNNNDSLMKINDLTNEVDKEINQFKSHLVKNINDVLLNKDINANLLNSKCNNCKIKKSCWSEISDDSILYLKQLSEKKLNLLIDKGITNLYNFPENNIDLLSESQKRQVISFKNKKTYFNYDDISSFLKTISNNYAFFKITSQLKSLPNKNEKPNQVIPIYYTINYKETLMEGFFKDEKKDLKYICKELNKSKTIITLYSNYEKTFLINSKKKYPELTGVIDSILLKIIDLSALLKNNSIYNYKMKNDFSINSISKIFFNKEIKNYKFNYNEKDKSNTLLNLNIKNHSNQYVNIIRAFYIMISKLIEQEQLIA